MAAEFGLHHLVVDDAIAAHQRPKLERYGDILFTVLRPARYIDQREQVEFGELHVITGDGFVVTIRHAESPDLAQRPPPSGISAGSPAARTRSRPLQHHGPGRRRVRPRRCRARERHRRNRGPALQQRPRRLTPHLCPHSRGDRGPAGDQAAARTSSTRSVPGSTSTTSTSSCSVTSATSATMSCGSSNASTAFRALLQNALTVNATLVGQRQNDEIQRLTQTSLDQNERGQTHLRLGRHPLRANPGGHHLRHELQAHARARLETGLPARTPRDGCPRSRAVPGLQAPRLALADRARDRAAPDRISDWSWQAVLCPVPCRGAAKDSFRDRS